MKYENCSFFLSAVYGNYALLTCVYRTFDGYVETVSPASTDDYYLMNLVTGEITKAGSVE